MRGLFTRRSGKLYQAGTEREVHLHRANMDDLSTIWQTDSQSGRLWAFAKRGKAELYLCSSEPKTRDGGESYQWRDSTHRDERLSWELDISLLPDLKREEGPVLVGVTYKTELEE